MYSIRRRLTLVLAVGFALLIAATGIVLAAEIKARLTDEFDAALLAKARALAALTEQEGGQIEFDYAPEHMPEFEREEAPEYFQFWLEDGQVLLRSTRLQADLPIGAGTAAAPAPADIVLPDGRAGRALTLRYVPLPPEEEEDPEDVVDPSSVMPDLDGLGLVLVVARGRASLDELIGRVRLAIFGVGGIAMLLAILLVWRALASGFAPIHAIASQVEQLDADSLGTRVTLPHTPRELNAVVVQLNALLHRLDDSFERERRFTGNVAHELRTPLAELRSLAAVGAQWPEDKASVVEFFEDVRQITGRMETTITDLLLLARCQAGIEQAQLGRVDVAEAVDETWRGLAQTATAAGLSFRRDIPAGLEVETDGGKLAIILANVLGNAVSYARPKTTIRATADVAGDRVVLGFSNAADPLRPEEIDRLTEPFWRRDASRSSEEHAGLGLALVQALTTVLGWDVRFDQDAEGRFHVHLSGPSSASGARRDPAGTVAT
ncbi:MAG: ATP-binding protein [Planctomycetota bacterium]|nr:ATP-binding protein [Planctomycetota bacterium]